MFENNTFKISVPSHSAFQPPKPRIYGEKPTPVYAQPTTYIPPRQDGRPHPTTRYIGLDDLPVAQAEDTGNVRYKLIDGKIVEIGGATPSVNPETRSHQSRDDGDDSNNDETSESSATTSNPDAGIRICPHCMHSIKFVYAPVSLNTQEVIEDTLSVRPLQRQGNPHLDARFVPIGR